ncbi:MAG: SDR family oxidoreductase [Candidatus Dadabacteria bacterium]|nr:MAG: SDR family oxidoreductase [Candidatus Dadabacteria bacterium]
MEPLWEIGDNADMDSPPLTIVTGATRGIGAAVTRRLLAQGWTVYGCYLRNRRAADAFAADVADLPGQFVPVKANVAKEADLILLVESAVHEHGGPIRGLVLNAASGVLRPLAEQTRKHWDWTMDINAWGAIHLAQLARPHMADGSSIVGLSSPGAVRAIPDYGSVGVSKAAIEAAMRQLAFEWGPAGIRVNTVRAGLVPTDALNHFPDRDALEAETRARTPLGRLVEPDDVAAAVAFLLGDDARAITGTTLVVDGGAAILS